MSIDGATPTTLEKLRRGLTWSQLLQALEFVKQLRNKGNLKSTTIAFVLQKDNFCEMCALLEMASNYCVDNVAITRIIWHGAYTTEEFRDIDIGDPQHPQFTAYLAAIEEAKQYHVTMLQNKIAIEGLGKSVPSIAWRLFG